LIDVMLVCIEYNNVVSGNNIFLILTLIC
jgi:hypothetical protein